MISEFLAPYQNMSKFVVNATSTARYFKDCSFGQGLDWVRTTGAMTIQEPGNQRIPENGIKRAMEK